MTNLERYKDEFVYMLKKNKVMLCNCFEALNNHDDCDTCPYDVESCEKEGCCNYRKFIDWLLEEHKEPIKLTKFEYDLLMSYINKGYSFKNHSELKEMRNKGYFEGVTDTSMPFREILKNCEVVD